MKPEPDPDQGATVLVGPDPEHLTRYVIPPRRLRGSLPGCAAGAWLDACERPRRWVNPTGPIPGQALGPVTIHIDHRPPAGASSATLQAAFDEGRLYERRRR